MWEIRLNTFCLVAPSKVTVQHDVNSFPHSYKHIKHPVFRGVAVNKEFL